MDCSATPRRLKIRPIKSSFVAISLVALLAAGSFTSSQNNGGEAAALAGVKAARIAAPANNDTENPDIYIDCSNPSLTVSLLLDRSGSVARDSKKIYGNASTAPNIYKKTVKTFVQKLHDEIASRGGKVDVYIYAFSTLTILQNPDGPTPGSRQTDISSQANVDKMKAAIDRIYFSEQYSKDENYPGEDSGNATPYDIARGYNARGFHVSPYGQTNWDDPLLETTNLASSNKTPDIGGHFDLSLMLTDGMPNLYNGDDPRHVWKFDAPPDNKKAVSNPAEVVTKLRTGEAIGPYGARSKVSVKGIFINPEIGTGSAAEQSAVAAMDAVFGSSNYTTASNFETELQAEMDKIIASIAGDSNCNGIDYVIPQLDLKIDKGFVELQEGKKPGTPVTVTLQNISASSLAVLHDVVITMYYNGPDGPVEAKIYVGTLAPGQKFQIPMNIYVEMGQIIPGSVIFKAEGTFVETETLKIDPNSAIATTEPVDFVFLGVNINRAELPS